MHNIFKILVLFTVFATNKVNSASRKASLVNNDGSTSLMNPDRSAIGTEECPSTLFNFGPEFRSSNPNTFRTLKYKPFVVGRDLIHDIGVCRMRAGGTWYYGFVDFGTLRCNVDLVQSIYAPTPTSPTMEPVSGWTGEVPIPNSTGGDWRSLYEFETMVVPKSVNIGWTSAAIVSSFPATKPKPLKINDLFIARCVIQLDSTEDPSIEIRIPLFFSGNDASDLSVTFNGNVYFCSQDKLEFPMCLTK